MPTLPKESKKRRRTQVPLEKHSQNSLRLSRLDILAANVFYNYLFRKIFDRFPIGVIINEINVGDMVNLLSSLTIYVLLVNIFKRTDFFTLFWFGEITN